MRNLKRVFVILFIINLFMIIINSNIVMATGITLDSMESDASTFITKGQTNANANDGLKNVTNSITSNFKGLGQILTMIGAGVMVAVTSYMGIKYIVSPPDKQAALKQQLVGLVAAGIVIFGAYGIWKAVLGVVQNF